MSACSGRYFGGETGQRLTVQVDAFVNGTTLVIAHEDLPNGRLSWPFSELRALSDGARKDQLTLTLRADTSDDSALVETARLTIDDDPTIAVLRRHCPNLTKRDVGKGTVWKVVSRSAMALSAVAVMIFVIVPALADTMARLIPIEREVRWGKAVVAQIERAFGATELGALHCENPEGLAALDAMVTRLTSGTDVVYDLNVQVFNHPMVNAFAAPGGQVVIMRGLLDKASSAEEVAGVLAHEIGHVESRDVTRNGLRAAGSAGLLSLVFGDFAGGTVAVLVAEAALNASYTREAEAEADRYAHRMLETAQVSARGLATFFDVLSNEERGLEIPEYLSSHPATEGRAEAAKRVAQVQGSTRPILTEKEWSALKGICKKA